MVAFARSSRVWLALSALAVFAWSVIPREPWVIDDALIYSSYARNLAEGHGLVYSAGPRVEGYSAPLWVLLLGLGEIAGLHGLSAAKGLGALLGAAAVVVFAFTPFPRRARTAHVIAVLCLALQPSFAWWAASGLDTSLALLLVLVATTRALRGDARGAAVAGALAALSRPEGPIFAFATGTALCTRGGAPMRRQLQTCAAMALPWAFWVAFRLAYYGEMFASTSTKLVADVNCVEPSTLSDAFAYLLDAFWTFPGEAVAMVGAACLAAPHIFVGTDAPGTPRPANGGALRSSWAAALTMVLALTAFVIRARGDWMPHARLFLPALPAVLIAVVSTAAWTSKASRHLSEALLTVALVSSAARQWCERNPKDGPLAAALLPIPAPHGGGSHRIPFLSAVPADGGANYYAAMLIHYTQPGERVLHLDVGQSGYLANDITLLDPFGLVSRDEALVLRRQISDGDYRARFAADPPVMAFLLVTADSETPVMRVDAVVEDVLARDYDRVALGPWWGGYALDIRVRHDAVGRHADRQRWERWVARARGVRFDPPDYLFTP